MNWLIAFIILSSLNYNYSWKLFHRGRGRNGNLGKPYTHSIGISEEKYFEQKLNHFDPSNKNTWQQVSFMFNLD